MLQETSGQRVGWGFSQMGAWREVGAPRAGLAEAQRPGAWQPQEWRGCGQWAHMESAEDSQPPG